MGLIMDGDLLVIMLGTYGSYIGYPHWVRIGFGFYAMLWQGAMGCHAIETGTTCIDG